MNLALCHEQEGRLARAWSEFNEAMRRREAGRPARSRGRGQRATSARSSRASRGSTVVVPAATQVEGLRVERDGHELGRGAWSTAIPVDGGEHVIRATALGREPFATTVVIGKESDARTVEIPVLATPVVVVIRQGLGGGRRCRDADDGGHRRAPPLGRDGHGRRRRRAARGRRIRAGDGAQREGRLRIRTAFQMAVTPRASRAASDAVSRGNLATILGVGGAVLVAAGATLFYSDVGRPRRDGKQDSPLGSCSAPRRAPCGGTRGRLSDGRAACRHLAFVAAMLAGGCNSVFGISEGTPRPLCTVRIRWSR